MPVVENCTVRAIGTVGYEITANEGYVIYDTTEDEEVRTYHYVFTVPASFDTSVLTTVSIADLPEGAEIFGNGAETVTE